MKYLLHRLGIYWTLWLTVAKYSFAETFLNRWTNILFFTGKAMRFGMSMLFLFLLEKTVKSVAGYSTDQVIIFYLVYQTLDTITQLFYRGVYEFSWKVRSGELDFYLSKPVNSLFRILTGKPDAIDAIFIIPTTLFSGWILWRLAPGITWLSAGLFLLLLINGFLIATAFHILVICLGVLTTEVDNAVMMYRDFNNLARFPVNMYKEPLRFILFLIVPVGLMNTVPAQVLLNLTPSYAIWTTILVGGGFFAFSLLVWKYAVRQYTSAGG